jgi:hypothetical protein
MLLCYVMNKVTTVFQVRNTFSPVRQNHYIFTPRDLTRWCLGFLRYDLKGDEQSVSLVLEVSVLVHVLTHLFNSRTHYLTCILYTDSVIVL